MVEREPINYEPDVLYIKPDGTKVYKGYTQSEKGVTCPRCNYTWATKSIMLNINCPNCNKRFRNPTVAR